MTDQNIELEAAKDSTLPSILARLSILGVDLDTAQLMMGYTRRSTPLLGDIRVVSVVAADAKGHAAEIVHMPLDDVDPITLDEQIIEDVLHETWYDVDAGGMSLHEVAHKIVAALRGGTITKES